MLRVPKYPLVEEAYEVEKAVDEAKRKVELMEDMRLVVEAVPETVRAVDDA